MNKEVRELTISGIVAIGVVLAVMGISWLMDWLTVIQ